MDDGDQGLSWLASFVVALLFLLIPLLIDWAWKKDGIPPRATSGFIGGVPISGGAQFPKGW